MKCLVKLNLEEFNKIKRKISLFYHDITYDGKTKIIKKRVNFPLKYALFITLFWMRNYFTDRIMSFFFGLSRIKINRIIQRVKKKDLFIIYFK